MLIQTVRYSFFQIQNFAPSNPTSVLKKFCLISLLCSKCILLSGIMGLKPTKDSNDRFYFCFYSEIKAIILELSKISPDTETPKK